MEISAAEVHRVRIPFKRAFGHALAKRSYSDTIILILRGADGATGCGEILPRDYLTGETVQTVLDRHLPSLLEGWVGRRFETEADVVRALREGLSRAGRQLATFCGLELALLDLAGRTFGFAAGEVLGPEVGPPLEAGVVIGFDIDTDALPRHCAVLRLAGRRHVKLKVGRDDDLTRLHIVRDSLGRSVPIRIDANGAWAPDDAIETLKRMVPLGIESVEQPVPAADLEGMRRVRELGGVPVMADESLCTIEDAQRLITMSAADIFNIRLGKCGGFLASLRLVQLAHQSGLRCHLGTLVGETGILSRAAETFGRRVPGFACLEGKGQSTDFLEEDVVKPLVSDNDGTHVGLGVRLRPDRLTSLAVDEPLVCGKRGPRG